MRTLFVLLVSFVLSTNALAEIDHIRVVPPYLSQLYDYSVKEGELAHDGDMLYIAKPGVNGNNQFKPIFQESEPLITLKSSASAIIIRQGSVFLGDQTYTLNSDLACNLATDYDVVQPTTTQIAFLYIVLDDATSPATIKCLVSNSGSGPANPTYSSLKWKRLYSFWTGGLFSSHGEKIYYTSGTDSAFSVTSPSACTALSFPKMSTVTQRAKARLTCNTAGSSSYSIYADSTCTTMIVASCNTSFAYASFFDFNPTLSLYYKGVVGAAQTINIIEINDPSKRSN